MTDDIRAEIAEKAGLPAAALRGATRDELQAHADQLAALGYSNLDSPDNLTPSEIVARATGRSPHNSSASQTVAAALGLTH